MTFDPKEYGRQYQLLNKEKITAKKKEWRLKNIDRLREAERQYRSDNKDKRYEYHKQWKRDNPERLAIIETRRRLKKNYNMTIEDYESLLLSQSGRCAICFTLPGDQKLVVDHCHKTNTVRGLLCSSCNRGIGLLQDSLLVVRSAVEYLGKRMKV